MAWLVLIVSGALEAGWAISLKQSEGFTRLWPTLSFGLFAIASLGGLAWAMKELPVGTAYAVWTGIGAALTATIGMLFLQDPVSVARIVSIVLIVSGVIGLHVAENAGR